MNNFAQLQLLSVRCVTKEKSFIEQEEEPAHSKSENQITSDKLTKDFSFSQRIRVIFQSLAITWYP